MLQDLFVLIFWLAMVVFVVVEAILIYSVIRFRQRPGQGQPPQVHGHTRLEIVWTIVPALILVGIAVPTIRTIFVTSTDRIPTDGLSVKVIGHQWWWEFQYPDQKIVTANEVHIPAGQPVTFLLDSADVIHSFWVPRLGGKRDVIPNRGNRLRWVAERPGEYFGECAEFCGGAHAQMRLRVFADSREDFDAWVKQLQTAPQTPTDPLLRQGFQVVTQGACAGCHTVDGTNARGQVGPNLTHVGSRKTIGAGLMPNNAQNLAKWISDPQSIKPTNKMPGFRTALSGADIQAVVAYLGSLK